MWCLVLALPIFPCSHPQSIFGANELNFRVRNGNGWTLIAINTNCFLRWKKESNEEYFLLSFPSSSMSALIQFGDPWESRTPVCGVRGRRLDHLTNGPFSRFLGLPAWVYPHPSGNGTPSGTRTLDTLIKSQVLYQLS